MFYIISEFKWIIQKLKIYIMNMFLIIYYLYNLELILKKKKYIYLQNWYNLFYYLLKKKYLYLINYYISN
jgi:hypothetical protein